MFIPSLSQHFIRLFLIAVGQDQTSDKLVVAHKLGFAMKPASFGRLWTLGGQLSVGSFSCNAYWRLMKSIRTF